MSLISHKNRFRRNDGRKKKERKKERSSTIRRKRGKEERRREMIGYSLQSVNDYAELSLPWNATASLFRACGCA